MRNPSQGETQGGGAVSGADGHRCSTRGADGHRCSARGAHGRRCSARGAVGRLCSITAPKSTDVMKGREVKTEVLKFRQRVS